MRSVRHGNIERAVGGCHIVDKQVAFRHLESLRLCRRVEVVNHHFVYVGNEEEIVAVEIHSLRSIQMAVGGNDSFRCFAVEIQDVAFAFRVEWIELFRAEVSNQYAVAIGQRAFAIADVAVNDGGRQLCLCQQRKCGKSQ